jgi:hypothetical protein
VLDEPKVLTKKIKSAVTDTGPLRSSSTSTEKPGVSNLLTILSVSTGTPVERSSATSPGGATATSRARSPRRCGAVRARARAVRRLVADPAQVDAVLADGAHGRSGSRPDPGPVRTGWACCPRTREPGRDATSAWPSAARALHQRAQSWRERLGDPTPPGIPAARHAAAADLAARRRPRAGQEHLRQVAAAGRLFEVHLRGTGTFRPVSPVVFVALARGIGDCERLERRSARPARAHAQLPLPPARPVAHDLDEPALDEAYEALASYDARFTVWGFTLFEQGPDQVWRPQRDFAFGRAACPARASRPRACLIIGG